MPDTLSTVELVWIISSLVAIGASLVARRWARADLRFVRDEYVAQGRGKHVARAIRRDVGNVTGRIVLSLAILAAGGLAAGQPNRPMTPAGWVIVALLFGVPIYLVWRTVAEATERRATLKDVARAYRKGTHDSADL